MAAELARNGSCHETAIATEQSRRIEPRSRPLAGELTEEQADPCAPASRKIKNRQWHDRLKQTLPLVRETVATPAVKLPHSPLFELSEAPPRSCSRTLGRQAGEFFSPAATGVVARGSLRLRCGAFGASYVLT